MRENPRFAVETWLDRTFGDMPHLRKTTWVKALGGFAQAQGSVIVETGAQRFLDDWGAGCSTHIFGLFLKQFGRGLLHSVDNSLESLYVAKSVAAQDQSEDFVQFHFVDSVQFLRDFQGKIDLLYLDSLDYSKTEPGLSACQTHQLMELEAAFGRLSATAAVLLDDNSLPGGGKTRLAKRFLLEQDWLCLEDSYQSLWIRRNSKH